MAEEKVSKAEKEIKVSKEVQERREAFERELKSLDKKFRGESKDVVIGTMANFGINADVKRFSSGSLVLDSITGGGFPAGRIIEIYGPESSGKTSIALNAIANVQAAGGNAAFIDAEQALDPKYAATLGVDIPRLALAQLSVAEDALQMTASLVSSGTVDLIVIDSVAALVPRQEAEGEMDKQQVGLMARTMSKALRILTPLCAKSGCTVIFLNQIREKVGVMFGNPETTPGGKALKFFASQRIEIRRRAVETEGKETIGTLVRMKVVKNKVAPPFKEGLTVLTFAKGINKPAEILVVGEELGVLYKQGNSYYYDYKGDIELTGDIASVHSEGTIRVATSKGNAIKALEEEADLYDSICQDVARAIADQREGVDPDLPRN